MIKSIKKPSSFLAILPVLFWCSCSIDYEIEKEAHVWNFVGLQNDTTAIVKVSLEQWGTSHDNHLMGWDDDFHNTIDVHYYAISMNSYKIKANEKKNLPELDSTEKYYVSYERAVDYSPTCAIILQNQNKKPLDTLEIDHCPKENSAESPKFVGNYLKIDNRFYKIEKGKFPYQKPAYKFEHKDYSIKFTDINGKYIIYGGKP